MRDNKWRLKYCTNKQVAEAALDPHFDFTRYDGCKNSNESFWFVCRLDHTRTYEPQRLWKHNIGVIVYSYNSPVAYVFHYYEGDERGEKHIKSVCFIRRAIMHFSRTTDSHISYLYDAARNRRVPVVILHLDADFERLAETMTAGDWIAEPRGSIYGYFMNSWKRYVDSVAVENKLFIYGDKINYSISMPIVAMNEIQQDLDVLEKYLVEKGADVMRIGAGFFIQTMKPILNTDITIDMDVRKVFDDGPKLNFDVRLVKGPVTAPWIMLGGKYSYRRMYISNVSVADWYLPSTPDNAVLLVNNNICDMLVMKGRTDLLTRFFYTVSSRYGKNDKHYKYAYILGPVLIPEYIDVEGVNYNGKECSKVIVGMYL